MLVSTRFLSNSLLAAHKRLQRPNFDGNSNLGFDAEPVDSYNATFIPTQ